MRSSRSQSSPPHLYLNSSTFIPFKIKQLKVTIVLNDKTNGYNSLILQLPPSQIQTAIGLSGHASHNSGLTMRQCKQIKCVTPIVTINHTVLFDPNFTCFIVFELLACYTYIPRKNTDLMYIETCEASVRIKQI